MQLGIRESVSPAILAVATPLILVRVMPPPAPELPRRRHQRMRGSGA